MKSERYKSWRRELRLARTAFTCAIRQFKRIASIDDPIIRYQLPMEMLRIASDVLLSIGKMSIEERTEECIERLMSNEETPEIPTKEIAELTEETAKVVECIEEFQNFLEEFGNLFSDWISTPNLDPDHPLGKRMMVVAEKDFLSKTVPP